MKNKVVSAMLALALTGSIASAQTADRSLVDNIRARNPVSNALSPADRIAAARSLYTAPEDDSADSTAHSTLAQFPGRQAGPPPSHYGGYPRPYPNMWRGSGSGRHAAIGALIGFGIGAALGAKANKDPTPGATLKASLLVGSVVGVLGALIGQGAPPYARLQRPRPRGTDKRRTDQDEVAARPPEPDPDTSKPTHARERTAELAAKSLDSQRSSADSLAAP